VNILVVTTPCLYSNYLVERLLAAGHNVYLLYEHTRPSLALDFSSFSCIKLKKVRLTSRQKKIIKKYTENPLIALVYVLARLCLYNYFSKAAYHALRIFGGLPAQPANIPIFSVQNIGNASSVELFTHEKIYQLVLVHGTSLIPQETMRILSHNYIIPMINIHWGYSPFYRGEGIITCLAKHDYAHLGATVHKLVPKADAGAVFSNINISIDSEDNFLSIGYKMTKAATDYIINALDIDPNYFAGSQNRLQDLSLGRCYSTYYIYTNPWVIVKGAYALRKLKNG